MTSSETFVDVTYRGLDAGRRLKLTDLGPETGYLEMPRPLPVGARFAILTDEGHEIAAEVVRVHEQVAGAEMPPGVRLRARVEGEAAAWWSSRVSRRDPPIPAPPPPPSAKPLPIDTVGVPFDELKAKTDEAGDAAPAGERASGDGAASEPESEVVSEPAAEPAAEAAEAAEPAAESAAESDTQSNPANGERKKRKRGRRRRR